jgi:hypothetical protein
VASRVRNAGCLGLGWLAAHATAFALALEAGQDAVPSG